MEKLFHEIPVIRGENLELRKLETSDARSLENSPAAMRFTAFFRPFFLRKNMKTRNTL